MHWKLAQRQKERLARETGYKIFPRGDRTRFALVYPNSYFVGMSNLGFHIIYDILNNRSDTACERFFRPMDKEWADYVRTGTPLFSMETQTPLADFAIVGFAVSFEMDYFHVLDVLRQGRVTVLAAERNEREPLVVAGGPCATFNPAVLSPFVDIFVIGEGEETVSRLVAEYRQARAAGCDRWETIARLGKLPGIFAPSLYEPQYDETGRVTAIRPRGDTPARVARQWLADLDKYPAHTAIVTDDTEFSLYLIETARGCGRHCRFCMAGYAFRRPRNRSLAALKEQITAAKIHNKRLGLMGAAISDYPQIDELCDFITADGQTMSVASFRADSVTEKLVRALSDSGLKTITVAPEAGSADMRAVINKGIEEGHIFRTLALGAAAGIKNFRMYIMIGLPDEKLSDVEAVADLAERARQFLNERGCRGMLTLSVNPFIPKPFTPFQWLPMDEKKSVARKLKLLRDRLKKLPGVELKAESVREAYVQGVLARGDSRVGLALYRAWQNGGAKAFRQAMKDEGLDEDFYLYRRREEKEIFPWDMIDIGVERSYLWSELKRAAARQNSVPCFDGCSRCGVCKGAI